MRGKVPHGSVALPPWSAALSQPHWWRRPMTRHSRRNIDVFRCLYYFLGRNSSSMNSHRATWLLLLLIALRVATGSLSHRPHFSYFAFHLFLIREYLDWRALNLLSRSVQQSDAKTPQFQALRKPGQFRLWEESKRCWILQRKSKIFVLSTKNSHGFPWIIRN